MNGPNLYLSGGLVLISTLGGYVMGGSIEQNHDSFLISRHPVSLCVVNEVNSFAQMSIEEEQQTLDQFMSLEGIGVNSNES